MATKADKPKTVGAMKKGRRAGGAMGWHIVGWENRYEIPLAHRRDGRAGPLEYTKDYIQGCDDESIAARASEERLRQWANWLELKGAFGELKRRAGLRSRQMRGYLLDDRHRAAGPAMIAQWLGCTARKAAAILTRLAEVHLIERVRMPRFRAPTRPAPRPPAAPPKKTGKNTQRGGKTTTKKHKTVLSKTRKSALALAPVEQSRDPFIYNARILEGGIGIGTDNGKKKKKKKIGSDTKEKAQGQGKQKAQRPADAVPVPSPPTTLERQTKPNQTESTGTDLRDGTGRIYRIQDYLQGNQTEPNGQGHEPAHGDQEAVSENRSDPTCPTESDGPGRAQAGLCGTNETESDGSQGPQQYVATADGSGPGPSISPDAGQAAARGASEGGKCTNAPPAPEAWFDYEAFADQVMEALRYPHEPDRLWWRQERGTWTSQWAKVWRLFRGGTLSEVAVRRIWHGTLKEAARCVKCYGKPGRPLTKRGKVCCGLMNEQIRSETASAAMDQARASPAQSI